MNQMVDPRNCETWTSISKHPIFSNRKKEIATWSHFPTEYGRLDHYTNFDHAMYCDGYDLDELEQRITTSRDVDLLKTGCRALESKYPGCKYELIVADDCTISVTLRHDRLDCYFIPSMPDQPPYFALNIDAPIEQDCTCGDVHELVLAIIIAIA